jgi:hypothetical protein
LLRQKKRGFTLKLIYLDVKNNKMEPLIHQFSKIKSMPVELIESDNDKVIYDPTTQLSIYQMGGYTTSSSRSTDGTKPKNEADRVMDDN